MSDQQEQRSKDDGEEGELGQARADPHATRPPPSMSAKPEDRVIVEIDRPGDGLVKGVLEYDRVSTFSVDTSEWYDIEWSECEAPSPYGIFGPMIVICLN